MNRLISVIIPVKNGEKYLRAAIEGIRNQKMNTEIIVVNDASTDSTPHIAEELGCILTSHPQCRGAIAGKNTGLALAHGEYVLFHDADDVMREEALPAMYRELETHDEYSAVMAKAQDFVSPELSPEEAAQCSARAEAYFGVLAGTVLFRREVFDLLGPFDERNTAGEIIAIKTNMDQQGLVMEKIDLVALDRRLHTSNYGRLNRKAEFQNYASILRDRLRKRC